MTPATPVSDTTSKSGVTRYQNEPWKTGKICGCRNSQAVNHVAAANGQAPPARRAIGPSPAAKTPTKRPCETA